MLMPIGPQECFLCTETEPPLYRFCGCRNMFAHRHCMLQTIESVSAHRDECPVCKTRYKTKKTRYLSVSFQCHIILLSDAGAAVFLALMTIGLWDMWERRSIDRIGNVLVYAAFMLTCFGISLETRCMRGLLFPLSIQWKEDVHLLSLPDLPGAKDRMATIVQYL